MTRRPSNIRLGSSLQIGMTTAVLASGSLFAVQFHPEKSQRAGLTLLANFVRWDGKR